MTASQRIRYSSKTHRGHVRNINEDSVLALPDQGVWTVSDGMGGHEGGDYASQTVTEAMAMLPLELEGEPLADAVQAAIEQAHVFIQKESERRGGATMGATVVTLITHGSFLTAFWAGDSRIYRLRGGALEMLTTDHSYVAELVLADKLTWDEAEHHPQSHAITRAVGIDGDLELDRIDQRTESGDRYLLCSDGLTKYAPQAVLQHMLGTIGIETIGDRLLDLALKGGGADNISLIVIDIP
jgi:serine/threonine protein phosphatase PrpC